MSKSIYEEALEDLSILVKQANERKLSNDIVVNRWSLERIEKVINQAQKQEKLFERLYNVCKEYKHTSIGLCDDSEFINTMNDIEEELK